MESNDCFGLSVQAAGDVIGGGQRPDFFPAGIPGVQRTR